MSTTYRSLFLACDACKMQVDSSVKYCKHCGKAIWLKDATYKSTPTERPKPITEDVEKREDNLQSLQRAKLQNGLEKWLPTIFPDYYYVAPSPMPKEILDFLVQHMGKELIYEMNILGYGFDSLNKRIYVFDEQAMYYKSLTGDSALYQIVYSSIKELASGEGQLIIKTDSIGTKRLAAFRERDMAEMLSLITGAKRKAYESYIAKEVNGAGNSQPEVTPAQEIDYKITSYTIKDYVRDEHNGTMGLIMLATRGCLGIQCYVSFFLGAPVFAILFGVFAFAIAYHRPWLMAICWIYCVVMSGNPDIGTSSEFGGWYGMSTIFLTIALVYRFIIGIKYKAYMESMNK